MTFDRHDFDALSAFWNQFHPERYAIDSGLMRINTVDCPVFDWGASSIHAPDGRVEGFAIVKKSPGGSLYRGPDPDQAYLSAIAFKEPALGVDLLARIKALLVNRGVFRMVFGQDCRHFFPGCPQDFYGLRDFLRIEGFEETGESFDLEADLSTYQPPSGCLLDRKDAEFRMLVDADHPALESFLQREFPGRWHFDTMAKAEAEDRLDFIAGLFCEGELHGFAVTQDPSHRLPIGGAVWRNSLGPHWGALGPIGVSQEVRGRGLGHGLLAFGLGDLKRRGSKRTLIDWTTLGDFYGRHGFEVRRRYTAYSLSLGA